VSSTDALVGEIATAAREQAQGIEQINTAITQMDQVTQSNSASAEESASAAEELDAQAASVKDMVGRLRQLVGGAAAAPAPTPGYAPAPVMSSHIAVFSNQPASRTRARHPAQRTLGAGHRKTIPMPGDTKPASDVDDDNFKSF
jgi:uncharacterized phage infection (PIP) family protein YhgE